ncbi:MAG: S-methyl-5-thioribose-1-phosphate isomerase [Planctomycetes bacterium]|nr:S-methyl-5-thioribose-1-phosphate isomerase [Planctomycetota bacterium]
MEPTLRWVGDAQGHLALVDQTLLPSRQLVLEHRDLAGVIDSIKRLAVRGAPAIGVAAGFAVVIGVRERAPADAAAFQRVLDEVVDIVSAARPTAVNLAWAAERLRERGRREPTLDALLDEARAIHDEDVELCRAMGEVGADLIKPGFRVLTHCNAGRLATGGDGTALAVMFAAHARGTPFKVFADETRPLLQGSRLTALELSEAGIEVDVIVDSAAAGLIARGEVDLILTGADRVAANGDAANKVGTYGLSLAAKEHGVPMYIVAPASTFDLSVASGAEIPIEDRDPEEVLSILGHRIAAPGVGARNPAFDVTPAGHLAGLVTDRGLIHPITTERIKATLG